ncbi:MAG: bifunctional alpha,alpha-trehalose-phosphate synthase (UDP-forming)/trehalose-phosphatase [Planctomycetota bacterium JB042]
MAADVEGTGRSERPRGPEEEGVPSAPHRAVVVVSNRLPVRVTDDGAGGRRIVKSSGGLASALAGVSREDDFLWIGWPGAAAEDADGLAAELARDRLFPVPLDDEDVALFYHRFSNGVLWPLFHYFTAAVDHTEEAWRRYVDVNRRYAETVAAQAPPNALVWVHDFHLALVPRFLRHRRDDVAIGFFLHIPFPSSEIYRLLPSRAELLEGILGADYVGFHTSDYSRHFRSSCLRVLGLESTPTGVVHEGRTVGLGVDPIGVDVGGFREVFERPETARREEEDRADTRRVILGVERLDYTKGVPHKLRAFERFLARDPSRAERVVLRQLLVPSRLDHPDYRELKRKIEETVGRINGTYGRPGTTPIEYLYRSVPPEELVALYRTADVGLVAPLRDGMNLVAQEYVLCQGLRREGGAPGSGVLVLSEFAGAAQVLADALLVNPWDTEGMADALETALDMHPRERRERLRRMAVQVESMDCKVWAERSIRRIVSHAERSALAAASIPLRREVEERACSAFAAAERRLLLLDYDGTLREIMRRPEEARPTPELLRLLRGLAEVEGCEVHVVSGRPKADLDEWLGDLPIHLCAEHGYTWRAPGGEWETIESLDLSWLPHVRQVLTDVTHEVPGTLVEEKSCGLAWHYRMAEMDYGRWRAHELLSRLQDDLADTAAEVLRGHRVIEVRALGVGKGRYARRRLDVGDRPGFLLCIGDDRTDRDMFRELPEDAWTVHVGQGDEEARYRLPSPPHVREFLRRLLASS